MLPSELLMCQYRGDEVIPKQLVLNPSNRALAQDLIDLFAQSVGKTRGELLTQLQKIEGDQIDYRIKRGLSHLLSTAYCTFEMIAPCAPSLLRQRVFEVSANSIPSPQATLATLEEVAVRLGDELDREIQPEQISEWLYADLPEHHMLTNFDQPTPDTLLHRYNLSQAQGVFYRATQVTVNVHRNDPGEYKLMFKYLKLFGLMTYVEGDADHGFTIIIDGPTSLFKSSTRYGLAIAKLLPAMLHVKRWELTAYLVPRSGMTPVPQPHRYRISSNCRLVSHYPPGKPFDSMLEQAFASRWEKTKTDWRLEREVDLIPLPGSVMIPDFRLLHPDGRVFLLEIVGYWRPDYLRKKFAQIRRAKRDDLILAVSQRLNLERAGVNLNDIDIAGRLVWFNERLLPKSVLALLEG
jgi:predicted nuclease of restriction endonuclease-like RecB superfamily